MSIDIDPCNRFSDESSRKLNPEQMRNNVEINYSHEINLFRFVGVLAKFTQAEKEGQASYDEVSELAIFSYNESRIKDIYGSLSDEEREDLLNFEKIFARKGEVGFRIKSGLIFATGSLDQAWSEFDRKQVFSDQEREEVGHILKKFEDYFNDFVEREEDEGKLASQREILEECLSSEDFQEALRIMSHLFGEPTDSLRINLFLNYDNRHEGGVIRHGGKEVWLSFPSDKNNAEIIRLVALHELVHTFQGEEYSKLVENFCQRIDEQEIAILGISQEDIVNMIHEAVAINISKYFISKYNWASPETYSQLAEELPKLESLNPIIDFYKKASKLDTGLTKEYVEQNKPIDENYLRNLLNMIIEQYNK